ncbi:phosphonate C-P lyase system protein PhnH [Paracoccus sp. (in: a-proteobacteria)]|uniref:phosphonate C-P lyase system protein PhnH n=1 Tax=Paracoccus sp. TaxID=267 RepID=UPI00396CCAFC
MSILSGGFTEPAQQSAAGFRVLMQAMARPGSIYTLAGAMPPAPLGTAAGTVLLLLADPTTPLHLAGPADNTTVREWLRFHAGCPLAAPEAATLAFGPWSHLGSLDRYPAGLPDYPDRSATLIVELDQLEAEGPRLTGPGICTHAWLSLPEIAPFQANRALFPRGLDFIFTCGDQLACLPRSTIVENS